MRKTRDSRYNSALEWAWGVLHFDYGITDEFIVERSWTGRMNRIMEPDLWSADKRVAVALGVLREDTLREYLKHFEEVVHLPFPAEFGFDCGAPTHYRVFRKSKAVTPLEDGQHHFNIWGDSLIHGRSLRNRS